MTLGLRIAVRSAQRAKVWARSTHMLFSLRSPTRREPSTVEFRMPSPSAASMQRLFFQRRAELTVHDRQARAMPERCHYLGEGQAATDSGDIGGEDAAADLSRVLQTVFNTLDWIGRIPAYTMKLRYLDFESAVAEPSAIAETAAVIGRLKAGVHLTMRACATLRADGEHIQIGDNVYFGEHATVHIVDAKIGTVVGNDVTIGRYGVVHGCTLGDHVVIAEGAAVLDGASVGPFAVIASDSIVPPRKRLAGGLLYAGVPAQPMRE